jgi:hypothetical protein
LNESHDTINSATSGYHETITRVYVRLLAAFSKRYMGIPLAERLACPLDGALADRTILLAFYSSSRLMSAEARLGWVRPDVAPIALEAVLDDLEAVPYPG